MEMQLATPLEEGMLCMHYLLRLKALNQPSPLLPLQEQLRAFKLDWDEIRYLGFYLAALQHALFSPAREV